MPWNETWPIGNVSVKSNRTSGNQNTTYIKDTMGKDIVGTNSNVVRDHFWDVGTNEDGRHRFINSPAFTVGGNPTDPIVGDGMDATLYLKTTNDIPQWFTRPQTGLGEIYQVSPNFLQGTIVVNSTYSNIVALPQQVYGEIFMFRNSTGPARMQYGYFKTTNSTCDAFAVAVRLTSVLISVDPKFVLIFANDNETSGLNLRVRTSQADTGENWNYRITYRAI